MKKKLLIIGGVLIVIVITVVLIILLSKPKYTVKISMVSDRSPDRILTVYDNKNNVVEFRRIELIDGTLICNGVTPSVYYGSIKDVKKVKVILKDKSEVIAKIVEEEVE